MESAMAVLYPELLQLPDLPTKPLACKMRLEDLFTQWLSLPDTQRLVISLLEDTKAGVALPVPSSSPGNGNSGSAMSVLPGMFAVGSTPSSPLSPKSPTKRSGASTGSPLKRASEPIREDIPQFYFPNGPPPPHDMAEQCRERIDQLFAGHTYGTYAL